MTATPPNPPRDDPHTADGEPLEPQPASEPEDVDEA